MRDDKALTGPPAAPRRETPFFQGLSNLVRLAFDWVNDVYIPAAFGADAELARRARLVAGFGVLGLLFGTGFATFYFFIGHYWGVGIIVVCTATVTLAPLLMRVKWPPEVVGNLLLLTLTLGFTGLCLVEGGLHGHAIAWLVSVPLCAMLLTSRKASIAWIFAAFLAASFIVAVDTVPALSRLNRDADYLPKWETLVCATGYMGLILFMSLLGHIFERGRTKAFAKKQEALAELAAMNERLVHLNKEKNVFLGIAAHDLKNPLTAILANAELLKIVHEEPAQVTRFAADIVIASTRMRDLITDLLDANAIEEGRFTSDLQPCDVSAMVERSAENYRFSASKKQIDIHVSASRGLRAKADPKAMMQILDNLVSNAVKYSPPKTTVFVRTFPEADHVLIAVKDEGPGVSEEDQKKLFGKFTRLSARPTGGESSTGLGLSIVKHLVEAMAGTIQCQTVLGFGATFTLKLPLWTDEDDARAEAKPPPAAQPGGRLTFRRPNVLN